MASGTVRRKDSPQIGHSGPSCSYREYHAAKTIEDVSYEMEIERFYRNILGETYLNRYASKPSRQLISKTTQTEPDTSNIPSSYLVLGQKLVDELYTDIGNIINTLYYTPNGYFKDDIEKSELDPKNTKVFRQSKSNPDVKSPTDVIRQIYTGEFKKALHGLFEKTCKLQNALPYIIEIEQGKVSQPTENVIQAGEDKVSRTEYENTGMYKDLNPLGNGFCRNQPGCSSNASGQDMYSAVEYACVQNVQNKGGSASGQDIRGKVGNASGQDIRGKVGNTSGQDIRGKVGNASGQDIRGKGGNASGQDMHRKAGNASSQNMSNKGGNSSVQDTHNKVENACNVNKEERGNEGHKAGKMDGLDSKNFIKRNIMMASRMSTRATTSKLVYDQKFALHEAGQQAKRNKK